MKLLYSNILPLGIEAGRKTISDCFYTEAKKADQINIAVGYISKAALYELDELVSMGSIKKICLIMGMYLIEGMPESTYCSDRAEIATRRNSGGAYIQIPRKSLCVL